MSRLYRLTYSDASFSRLPSSKGKINKGDSIKCYPKWIGLVFSLFTSKLFVLKSKNNSFVVNTNSAFKWVKKEIQREGSVFENSPVFDSLKRLTTSPKIEARTEKEFKRYLKNFAKEKNPQTASNPPLSPSPLLPSVKLPLLSASSSHKNFLKVVIVTLESVLSRKEKAPKKLTKTEQEQIKADEKLKKIIEEKIKEIKSNVENKPEVVISRIAQAKFLLDFVAYSLESAFYLVEKRDLALAEEIFQKIEQVLLEIGKGDLPPPYDEKLKNLQTFIEEIKNSRTDESADDDASSGTSNYQECEEPDFDLHVETVVNQRVV